GRVSERSWSFGRAPANISANDLQSGGHRGPRTASHEPSNVCFGSDRTSVHEVFLRGKPCDVALEKVSDDAVGGASGIRNRGTVVPSKRGCVFNQVRCTSKLGAFLP